MSDSRHLRSDHYALATDGRMGRGAFALQLHQHLVGVCPTCAEAWRLLAEGQGPLQSLLVEAAGRDGSAPSKSAAPPLHHQTAFSWEARQLERELQEVRAVRGAACKKSWELLQVAPEERAEKVRGAITRFRSRAEAEYILDKAREVIRDDPREAENLASLVPLILHWMPQAAGAAWAIELIARAAAWRANALRVAGELHAADRAFALLRRDLAGAEVQDPAVLAEIASLEASLRTDQRRLDEAHRLLDLAEMVYESLCDSRGKVRSVIQKGNLWVTAGETEKALGCFEAALEALESLGGAEPHLLMAAVNGTIVGLCDLGHFEAASDRLDRHLDLYEDTDLVHAGGVVRHHRGRIALGLRQFPAAEEHLLDAQQAFLTTERAFDALLVALDLALLYSLTGRPREVRPLATRLVSAFRAQEVEREAMVALRLLLDAAEADSISQGLLQRLRQRLLTAPHSPLP